MYPPQGPPRLNVPLPDPSPLAPQSGMESAIPVITSLFSMGQALGGSPMAGAAFLDGAQRSIQHRKQEREVQARQQQQVEIQQQQQMAQQQARQEALEQAEAKRRQDFILSARTAAKGITDRAQFDEMLDFYENFGQREFGLRPNTVRGAVRYFAPDAKAKVAETLKAFVSNPMNKGALETGQNLPAFSVDTDGDGIAEKPLSFAEAADFVKDVYPIALNPATGGIVQAPKATNPDKFDQALEIETGLFAAEKGHAPKTPQEQALVYDKANRRAKTPPDPKDPAASALSPRQQTQLGAIANAFRGEPIVKRTNTMAEAVSFVNSLPANSSSPADDQALIYAFAKAMDPESVVREGEYATVAKYAQSWVSTFGFNAERVVSNSEFLTPHARKQLKETILKKYASSRTMYDNVRKGFSRQIQAATQGQADPEDYLTDYAGAFPNTATGAPPAAASPETSGPVEVWVRDAKGKLVKKAQGAK